ncbi:hypothetical protein [Pseudolabrys sp. FHR47]|uniref:hypothetical protein n=1 Tax=Pseudolabrys sp. FHR47 TaxID=2562284 RepID=UPI0010BEB274|nr:hypothetical protein [Pseudolabrys sp. FHR47]
MTPSNDRPLLRLLQAGRPPTPLGGHRYDFGSQRHEFIFSGKATLALAGNSLRHLTKPISIGVVSFHPRRGLSLDDLAIRGHLQSRALLLEPILLELNLSGDAPPPLSEPAMAELTANHGVKAILQRRASKSKTIF